MVESGTAAPFHGSAAGLMTFTVPAANIPPGAYLVVASGYFPAGTPTEITVEARVKFGASQVGPTLTATGRGQYAANTWALLSVGGMVLPSTEIPNPVTSTAVVEITASAGSSQVEEVWLFRMSGGGSLTAVSGVPQRLSATTPSPERAFPGLWMGASASTMRHATTEASAWGNAEFHPPSTKVFIATSGTATRNVTFRHFPRWHSNAAE